MMPVNPTPCHQKLTSLIPRWPTNFNGHIWHQPLLLPTGETIGNDLLNLPLSLQIFLGHGRKKRFLMRLIK